jgi:hypothetical protein
VSSLLASSFIVTFGRIVAAVIVVVVEFLGSVIVDAANTQVDNEVAVVLVDCCTCCMANATIVYVETLVQVLPYNFHLPFLTVK